MIAHTSRVIAIVAATLAMETGCVTRLAANSPIIVNRLKLVSAGHTGCLPDANEISNVTANLDGSGMWNATCNGKTYLCTAVASVGSSESFSCAPAAQ
jgi:hypothetical protein